MKNTFKENRLVYDFCQLGGFDDAQQQSESNSMQQKTENLIKSLARKDLTFGCKFLYGGEVSTVLSYNGAGSLIYYKKDCNNTSNTCSNNDRKFGEIIGHQVYIGDVLEKIGVLKYGLGLIDFVKLWEKCGFTKSLQEIFEEAEWSVDRIDGTVQEIPKNKALKELFEFLLSLGL